MTTESKKSQLNANNETDNVSEPFNTDEASHFDANILSSQSMHELWASITAGMPDDGEDKVTISSPKDQVLADKMVSSDYKSKLPKPF
ncbi:hypothetical protein RDB90_005221 [Salmonella enterica]|uniref:Uncharacterized protein n=1 Tax=Salmonella enterica TaxID=28901 RepID=A0A759MEH5_SALER|nr:hypothetical protein [Salmonella enterica subsp. enterica serovar Anatum]EEI9430759.1 hypothetical protein [Salmonella enterica subsp. diarizonae]ELE1936611.1 hypothetical protein [Salmonella enterica]MJZ70828.1 hypothetical protein [Salmonella enterica subsp. enterica]EDV5614971.1 hypothetical protein [Salmonella enterica subsp. enterica serovar Anatum]